MLNDLWVRGKPPHPLAVKAGSARLDPGGLLFRTNTP